MDTFRTYFPFILPVLSFLLLLTGIKQHRIQFILLALWISLIAVLIQYHAAGGEILGQFYNYLEASLYSLNITIVLISLGCIILEKTGLIRYLSLVVLVGAFVGYVLLMINVWMNACFIENKLPGTLVLQVALLKPTPYCRYHYVFYRVNHEHQIDYLCPNFYLLIPSSGTLSNPPSFMSSKLAPSLWNKVKNQSYKQANGPFG